MFNFSYLLLFWWFDTLKEEIYTKYNLQNLKAVRLSEKTYRDDSNVGFLGHFWRLKLYLIVINCNYSKWNFPILEEKLLQRKNLSTFCRKKALIIFEVMRTLHLFNATFFLFQNNLKAYYELQGYY